MAKNGIWVTRGFEDFSLGTFGNAGHNLYVSRAGVLQRIHQYDFNKNGYLDLVFCNDHSHWESPHAFVYQDPLGKAALTELPTDGAKTGVVADLNGNGYDDIVLGMWHNGIRHDLNAFIFFGGADGWSERRQQLLPAPTCTSVTAGDFNGDGHVDLAFLCREDMDWLAQGQLRLFYQTNLGLEQKRFTDLSEVEGDQLASEDLDGDGYDDLVVRSRSGEVRIFWGGPGGIDPERVTAVPVPLDQDHPPERLQVSVPSDEWIADPTPLIQIEHLGDVPYLFVAREESVFLVPVDSDRCFDSGPPLVLACPQAIAMGVGDINGDGYQDLVIATAESYEGGESTWIYWGSAQGYDENRRTLLKSFRAYDVVVADLDGDGYDDIVLCQGRTTESYTGDSFIYRGARHGVHDEPVRLLAHFPQRVLLARASVDEQLYLVFVNSRSGNLRGDIKSSIYFGGPEGFSSERQVCLNTWRAVEAVCCDINDNGYPDVVFANSFFGGYRPPGAYVYLNGPEGFSDQPTWRLPMISGHGVCCADINRDGYLDLIFCDAASPDLLIFYGSANGFSADNPERIHIQYEDTVHIALWIFLADLNNDGWLDLVVPQISGDRSVILWGGPDGFSIDRCQLLSVWHASCARAADLNGNGYLDLIVGGHAPSLHGPHDSFVYIYWNGPAGLREDDRTLLPASAVNSMTVADFNNNGHLDLFITSYHNGRERDIDSYIYWNRGERGFSATDRQRLFTHSASGCMSADFNEDGWVDLAIANHKVQGKHVGYSAVWWNGPDGFDEKRITKLPTMGPHGMTAVGAGNIMDRGPEEYYVSSPFNLPAGAGVQKISWQADVPAKTWVKARLRFAEIKDELVTTPWIGPDGIGSWFENSQHVDATQFCGQWVQYQLSLGATNSLSTPRVTEVNLSYGE